MWRGVLKLVGELFGFAALMFLIYVLLVGVEAGTRVGVRLAQGWHGFAEGAVSALIWRPRFVLEGVGQVHQPERLGLRFGLGAEWRAF